LPEESVCVDAGETLTTAASPDAKPMETPASAAPARVTDATTVDDAPTTRERLEADTSMRTGSTGGAPPATCAFRSPAPQLRGHWVALRGMALERSRSDT
jgi:hypothetical protein